MLTHQKWLSWVMLIAVAMFGVGCTQSQQNGQADSTSQGASDEEMPELPMVAIEQEPGEEDPDEKEPVVVTEPEEGTPEWHIREILRIRLQPYPTAKETVSADGTPGGKNTTDEMEQQSQARRERNLQVIELAKQAIALTHKKPEKEIVFNAAVHHLLDARLQLALAGDQEDVDALYEIAEALQNSRPNSEAAAAAALTIVNFSHANAVRYAQTEPRWIQEFARQAQMFAGRVTDSQAAIASDDGSKPDNPRATQIQKDVSRAAQILMAAGQSCDAAGFPDDAKTCYSLLKSKFPETVQAQQVAGIIRRLNLKGQPLELAGPTLDGNFLSVDDFKGKTVLVVFWSSQAKPFLDQLPALTELLKKAQKHVAVIGVNLDSDESQLDAFLEETGLSWPQIFFSEPDKRGWNSPIANHYGIINLPTFWILDSAGVVAETDVSAKDMETKLKDVVRQSLRASNPNSKLRVVPVGNETPGK